MVLKFELKNDYSRSVLITIGLQCIKNKIKIEKLIKKYEHTHQLNMK
jgi:hypothetical protein